MKNIYLELTHYDSKSSISPYYKPGENTGVGNMLFQIASCYAYAKKHNAKLNVIGLNTYFQLEKLDQSKTIFRNIDTNITPYQNLVQKPVPNYIFDYPFSEDLVFNGYFEVTENFDFLRDTIVNLFSPSEKDIEYLKCKYPCINENTTSTIHIRGGSDYKSLCSANELNQMIRGYHNCMNYMIKNKNIKTFIVVTNDKQYAKNILDQEEYKNLNFIYSDERDYFDIWLISLAKNNIVSQSTLGWWGSYLNKNEDSCIVYCPTRLSWRPLLTYYKWIMLPIE